MDRLIKALTGNKKDVAAAAASSPLYKSLVQDRIFESGNGQVIISRRLPDGQIATGVFFVDVWCVGIKTSFFAVMSSRRFRDILNPTLREVDPSYARKLVEEAVRYAEGLGLEQPADYQMARKVLGDINPAACREAFRFGKGGKPCFVSWPTCPPERARTVMETLTRTCGLGGFEFTA